MSNIQVTQVWHCHLVAGVSQILFENFRYKILYRMWQRMVSIAESYIKIRISFFVFSFIGYINVSVCQFPAVTGEAVFQRISSPTSLLRRQAADECYVPPEWANERASIVSAPPLDILTCVSLCRCSVTGKNQAFSNCKTFCGSGLQMTIHHLLSGYTFVITFQRAQAPGHTTGTEEVVKGSYRGDDLMAYQLLLEFDYLSWAQTVLIWWVWVWSLVKWLCGRT